MQDSTPSVLDNSSPATSEFSWTLCPGCAERQRDKDPAPCNICGRINPVRESKPELSVWASFCHWMARPLGWGMQICTLCVALLFLWQASVGTIPGSLTLFAFLVWIPLIPIWLLRLFFRIAFFENTQKVHTNRSWCGYLLLPLCIVIFIVAETTHIVPKIGLWLARPSLLAIIKDRSRSGKQSHLRAGPYRILEIERYSDEVRLEVSQGEWVTSITHAGFAYRTQPPIPRPSYDDAPEHIKLAPGWYWYFYAERYYAPIDTSIK